MSVTIKVGELPISKELTEERKVKIGILLNAIVFCLLAILLSLGALKPNIKHFKIFKIRFWMWSVLGLFIILGRLVSDLILKFIVNILKLNRFCRVRILFFVTEEKNSLHRFFWSVIVFLVGYYIIYRALEIDTEYHDENHDKILTLLFLVMVGCFAWLTMSILLKLHEIESLNEIYFDRVIKTILEQYVLRMLLSSPERQNLEISKFNDLNQLNKKDITARIVDKLMSMVKKGSLPSIKELYHKDNLLETAVTKSILQNIIKLGFRSSHVENIRKFLQEQRALSINIFEGDKINEKALHLWVERVYKDRQALVSDMKETDTAITKQHVVVRIAVGVILIFYTCYFLKDGNEGAQAPAAPPELPPIVYV